MNDKVLLRGHFKVEAFDKLGNIIDSYEEHNLITDIARTTFAKLLAGISTQNTINRFVMGTKGHQDGDVLIPKDSTSGFDSTRTNLFSGTQESDKNILWNEIRFTPTGNITQTSAVNVLDGSNNNSSVNIQISGLETSEPTVTYTISISADSFSGVNDGIVYTEAGLFADDIPIALKCFPGKIKDSSTSLRITWNIIF